ncbi:hypothetical protein BDP81DRAFT_473709 [Colletotrichum phormii]|uniref:Uncharacterized protein n=1 Tax=Colletotrichum phormii TaxID=359342 RepID=A0AAI9ZK61_9PEZI|nr:uncharacterized protein BDP81DRAFT_473709 [Colletotrichum phormii]KAK1633500.1 hypothetical protein BDP81DRAFT_473709 [Colletotrichum phormii]
MTVAPREGWLDLDEYGQRGFCRADTLHLLLEPLFHAGQRPVKVSLTVPVSRHTDEGNLGSENIYLNSRERQATVLKLAPTTGKRAFLSADGMKLGKPNARSSFHGDGSLTWSILVDPEHRPSLATFWRVITESGLIWRRRRLHGGRPFELHTHAMEFPAATNILMRDDALWSRGLSISRSTYVVARPRFNVASQQDEDGQTSIHTSRMRSWSLYHIGMTSHYGRRVTLMIQQKKADCDRPKTISKGKPSSRWPTPKYASRTAIPKDKHNKPPDFGLMTSYVAVERQNDSSRRPCLREAGSRTGSLQWHSLELTDAAAAVFLRNRNRLITPVCVCCCTESEKSEETANASELWMTGTFAWPTSKKLQTRVGSGLRGSSIALVAARSKTWLGAIPLSPAASLDTLRQAARTVGKLAGLCQDAGVPPSPGFWVKLFLIRDK